jgi:hypothetical protein
VISFTTDTDSVYSAVRAETILSCVNVGVYMPYVQVSCQGIRSLNLSEAVVEARLNISAVYCKQIDLFISPHPLGPARYCACGRSDTSNRSLYLYLLLFMRRNLLLFKNSSKYRLQAANITSCPMFMTYRVSQTICYRHMTSWGAQHQSLFHAGIS